MRHALTFLVCLLLAACGGGGGGTGSTAGNSAATLSGVAATGAPIVGRVYLKDASGNEQHVDTSDGSYSFLLTGLTPPFMLKAEWLSNGVTQKLYSFSSSASGGTANITPLTQMIVVAAANGAVLDSIYAAPSSTVFATISTGLPSAITDVQKSLLPLLTQYSAFDIDPIAGTFAANHTGMDALLDSITVAYSSNGVTVADKITGTIILDAPAADPLHGLAMPDWSAQDAAVANDPDIAVDHDGNGLVVWSEQVSSHYVIRARFLAGTGTAVTLSSSGDSSLPRVAFDATGNAMAVWAQYENNRNDVWSSRYDAAAKTWSTSVRISPPNALADASGPDVGVDDVGNAVATWTQGDGRTNHFDVWSARYVVAQNTWNTPAMVSDGVNSAYGSHIAINAAGQGFVAWQEGQDDGTTVSNGPTDIQARSVTTAGVWGTSTQLNAVGGNINTVYGQIAVAVDSSGNGFALWVQSTSVLPFVIHAARYASGSGWQTETVITNNAIDNSYGPHLAFDAAGNAVAVWQQQTGTGAFGAMNRYVAGTGWGVSGNLDNTIQGDTYDPHVAVDGDGNATVVWYQWETSGINIRINRYLIGSGWGASRILSTTSTDGGFTYPVPRVAANAAGQAMTVWGVDSN